MPIDPLLPLLWVQATHAKRKYMTRLTHEARCSLRWVMRGSLAHASSPFVGRPDSVRRSGEEAQASSVICLSM